MPGILLVNKPKGKTSFYLVEFLRRLLGERKIGHAGTLDPLATGVMVMLVGKEFTRLSDTFVGQDKEYEAQIHLGKTTDTYDAEGAILSQSPLEPTLAQIETELSSFQGWTEQIPPMYSAKKIGGKKLYDLARQGKTIERPPQPVFIQTTILSYSYPLLTIHITCSKGTYIRSLAHDLGQKLSCGAHLQELCRLRSGPYHLKDCHALDHLQTAMNIFFLK